MPNQQPAATKRKRAMRSPCCDARVVVPVDVTAHLLVDADGTLSGRITDTLRGIRWSANQGDATIEEAYCEGCGSSVDASKRPQEASSAPASVQVGEASHGR